MIWVVTKPEICHQRMIDRNSVRDTWKLEHWDEYVKTIDYSIPEALKKNEQLPRSDAVLQFFG